MMDGFSFLKHTCKNTLYLHSALDCPISHLILPNFQEEFQHFSAPIYYHGTFLYIDIDHSGELA